METLKDKVIFITGGSRGIGSAIAIRAAQDGAKVVIASKTADPHPTLPGTIHTVAKEIEEAGGQALPLQVDVRDEAQIQEAVKKAVETFGGIDILINNASAINLTNSQSTPMKRYDLMQTVNTRGTYATSAACYPFLKKSSNPHILTLSPPLNLNPKWFKNHTAYTISKYGMSMCTLGLAEEYRKDGIAVNSLWPQTVIDTAALNMIPGVEPAKDCRKIEIMSDAAHYVLTRKSSDHTGQFFIDETVLREKGVTDFDQYNSSPDAAPMKDLFLD